MHFICTNSNGSILIVSSKCTCIIFITFHISNLYFELFEAEWQSSIQKSIINLKSNFLENLVKATFLDNLLYIHTLQDAKFVLTNNYAQDTKFLLSNQEGKIKFEACTEASPALHRGSINFRHRIILFSNSILHSPT